MTRLALTPRPRILIIVLRRLGDVLLTTPLMRSLRRAWPEATIDSLVFAGTAGILKDNPDLDDIITMPDRPTVVESAALAARLWKRYDLAISSQCGDRPTFFTFVAGRVCVAPVEQTINGRLKRLVLHRSVPYVGGVHRVEEILRLADLLGISRAPQVVCSACAEFRTSFTGRRLCGDPCSTDVPVQAMDEKRLAGTGRRADRAWSVSCRNRWANRARTKLS